MPNAEMPNAEMPNADMPNAEMPKPTESTQRLADWHIAVGLLVVTLLAHSPAMQAEFVWNDEDIYLNPVLKENGLYRIWFTTEALNYWPVTFTSYWLESRFYGLHPTGYHVVNVLLHAVNVLLVWRLLKQWEVPGAWFAALVFGVHPVTVQSVAWAVQRKNLLAMAFMLGSLLFYFRSDRSQTRAKYWGALGMFALSLLSKSATTPFPVALLLITWWRNGQVKVRDVLRTVPFFLLSLLAGITEIWFQYVNCIGVDQVRTDGPLGRIACGGWSVWFYLFKALWPVDLIFVYPRWEIDTGNWLVYIPTALLVVLPIVLWSFRKTWGSTALAIGSYYIVMLSPVLGAFDMYSFKYSFVSDHYQYFSLVAVIAGIIAVLFSWTLRQSRRVQQFIGGAGSLIVCFLALLTWNQAHVYLNNYTLWADTIEKNPTCSMAYQNLGELLWEQGEIEAAGACFERSISFNERAVLALNSYGKYLYRKGRLEEALAAYEEAARGIPQDPASYVNAGLILLELGDARRALEYLEAAQGLRPESDFVLQQIHKAKAAIASSP